MISPKENRESQREAVQKAIKSQENYVVGLIIRTIIICIIFDGGIWAYFHCVKKVSLIDGLKGWRYQIQNIFHKEPPLILEKDPMTKRAMIYRIPKYKKPGYT